jgi:Macrocin-O-methyltransferase (TylF)
MASGSSTLRDSVVIVGGAEVIARQLFGERFLKVPLKIRSQWLTVRPCTPEAKTFASYFCKSSAAGVVDSEGCMNVVAKLMRLYRQPRGERRKYLRQRLRSLRVHALFTVLRPLLNRPHSPFLLIARPDFDYDLQCFEDYPRLYKAWVSGMPQNGADVSRLYLLYLNARQILRESVCGDIVELGVYRGNSARVLREIIGSDRTLYLFDTFKGFDERDAVGIDARVNRLFFQDTSLEAVRKFVGMTDVVYVPGFFPESANTVTLPSRIALAHIDCDLYEPMKAALNLFYPRMAAGGVMILHDYASNHWPGATKAIDEFFADKLESIVVMPDKSGTAIARIGKNQSCTFQSVNQKSL